jgi:hypothetical protein
VDGLPGGGFPRCYTALKPVSYTCAKLPVVIYLSGIGQTIAGRCGPCCDDTDDVHAFADLVADTSKTGGFAMICPHALWFKGSADGQVWPSAMWDIPSPQTDESGQRCSASRDYDMMLALVNDLSARPEMDMDSLYIFGESLGASAAAFWSVCLRDALDKVGHGETMRACAPKIIEPPAFWPG